MHFFEADCKCFDGRFDDFEVGVREVSGHLADGLEVAEFCLKSLDLGGREVKALFLNGRKDLWVGLCLICL